MGGDSVLKEEEKTKMRGRNTGEVKGEYR